MLLAYTGLETIVWECTRRRSPSDDEQLALQPHLRRWCKNLLRTFGIHLVIEADEDDPADVPRRSARGRLVIANHRSPIDVAILLMRFGGHMLSRHDLATWPFIGAAARRTGVLFVDRDSPASRLVAMRQIRHHLEDGATVLVFPEGRVFPGDEVAPFHQGVFAAARGLDIDIVPVGLAYPAGVEFTDATFGAHVLRVARRRRTLVAVRIGAAFANSGPSTRLSEQAHATVQELVRQARQLHRASLK